KEVPDGVQGDDYIQDIKFNDRECGFDLTKASQMRLQVVNLGNAEYEFIWSHHHILIDGWCMSILINDFYSILNSILNRVEDSLPKALPYSNYIKWLD
ncbi:condensation domain-containing protein, partial [Rhizobium sp. SIMBA_035]